MHALEDIELEVLDNDYQLLSRYIDRVQGRNLVQFVYGDNVVKTSRYTLLTFLPMNLFEQFHEIANMYFFIIGLFQAIPEISTTQGIPTIYLPLLFILTVSATRAAIEDYSKHINDQRESSRQYMCHEPLSGFQSKTSGEIRVGDIIKIYSDSLVPADVLILSSAHPRGYCFVETSSLDGETSLKIKKSFAETQGHENILSMELHVKCEAPNKHFEQFKGILQGQDGKVHALDSEMLLLRDTVLKNTEYVIGMVVYTGSDTKIRQNNTTGLQRIPKSSLSKQMDRFLIIMFIVQFFLCFFAAVYQGSWTSQSSEEHWYLRIDDISDVETDSILRMFTWYIILAQFVPISLVVSLELVKTLQAYFIAQDLSLYDDKLDKPIVVQSLMLNEELGQIQYIFSDKTGTLTQNCMQFRTAIIGDVQYGSCETEISRRVLANRADQGSKKGRTRWTGLVKELGYNQTAGDLLEYVNFDSKQELLEVLSNEGDEQADLIHRFLVHMASSNTITPLDNGNGMEFQASSPDELALCHFGHFMGYTLVSRNPTTLSTPRGELVLELLGTLDFNSKRKRLTMIYKCSNGKVWVMTKGADSSILPLVSDEQDGGHSVLCQRLVSMSEYGLRTLVVAESILPIDWWEKKWKDDWEYLCSLPEVGDELGHTKGGCMNSCRICSKAQDIERSAKLSVLGATAIEDQLQELVPEAIDDFLEAGLKVWMLTGDKRETAKNIGLACNLISPQVSNEVIEITGRWAKLVEDDFQICTLFHEWDLNHDDRLTRADMYTFMELLGAPIPVDDNDNLKEVLDIDEFVEFITGQGLTMEVAVRSEIVCGLEKVNVAGDMGEENLLSMIVEGETLSILYKDRSPWRMKLRDQFFELASKCRSVICCRCTPHQKALIVEETRERLGAITLAIGDGANDEQMIQKADVGVGIAGLEGTAAARASDYAIGRFRHLHTLLFVHGVWSYQRISLLAQVIFYKTSFVTFGMFFFGAANVFSGQQFFHDSVMLFYNILFTSAPVIVVGVLDKVLPRHVLENSPQAYKSISGGRLCNWFTWSSWMMSSCFHAGIVFMIFCFALGDRYITREDGKSDGIWSLSQANFAAIVVISNFVSVFYMFSITWLHALSVFLSIILYFFIVWLGSIFPRWNPQVFGVFQNVFAQPSTWLTILLACSIPLLHFFCWESYRSFFDPSVHSVIREQERFMPLKQLQVRLSKVALRLRAWTQSKATHPTAKDTLSRRASLKLATAEDRVHQEQNRFFQRGGYAYDATSGASQVLVLDSPCIPSEQNTHDENKQ